MEIQNDIIDVNKETGKITVIETEGPDIVRLVDNGKVIDQYEYGKNGYFNQENILIEGEHVDGKGENPVDG